jgi:membrane-bound ClpP family serine protease
MNPDATYIYELQKYFQEVENKYNKGKNSMNLLLHKCCEITDVAKLAPKYMDKVFNLSHALGSKNANKEGIIESAYEQLANCITDTRNDVVHSNVTYDSKGGECPDEQKKAFIELLKIVTQHAIIWFSSIHESSRITS